MKQLLTPKEKFLKAIEDNYLNYESIADACTRINIEEKIELLNQLKLSPNSIMTEMINRNIESLQYELKQL